MAPTPAPTTSTTSTSTTTTSTTTTTTAPTTNTLPPAPVTENLGLDSSKLTLGEVAFYFPILFLIASILPTMVVTVAEILWLGNPMPSSPGYPAAPKKLSVTARIVLSVIFYVLFSLSFAVTFIAMEREAPNFSNFFVGGLVLGKQKLQLSATETS